MTVWLVAGAAFVALVVIVVGLLIHQPAAVTSHFHDGVCANGQPPGHGNRCQASVDGLNAVPMAVWFVVAAIAATLVIVAPFVTYMVKRSIGKI